MLTRFPALKLLLGMSLGSLLFEILVFSLNSSAHETLEIIILGSVLVCLAFCAVTYMKWEVSPLLLRGLAYWSACICLGAVIAQTIHTQSAGRTHLTKYTIPQRPIPEMRAFVSGTVQEVLRSDSLPTARIVTVLVDGIIDAESLARQTNTRLILTVIFPEPKLITKPNDFLHSAENSAENSAEKTLQAALHLIPQQIHAGSYIRGTASIHCPESAQLPTDRNEVLYAASRGASWLGVVEARNCGIVGQEQTWNTFVEEVQSWLSARIMKLFPTETAPFALALLTGNTRFLSTDTRLEYSRSGTAHVLALSGLHLVVVVGIVLVPLGFIRSRWIRFILFSITICGFVAATGMAASGVRAGVMAILFMLVQTLQRTTNAVNILSFSIICVLVAAPEMLFSIGFQMSIAATLGIIFILPRTNHFFAILLQDNTRRPTADISIRAAVKNNFVVKNITQLLALTLAASCTVAPIAAWYFGIFSLIAPLANLVVVPLSSLAMVYIMASVAIAPLWWSGAELFAQTAHHCLHWMNNVNAWSAGFSMSAIEGRWAFICSMASSILILYIVWSSSRRHFLFRVSVSIYSVCGVVFLLQMLSKTSPVSIEIYPRRDIVAAHIRNGNSMTLLLQDRKAHNVHARPDPAYERFLKKYALETQDSVSLIVTGQASMLVASRILGDTLLQKRTRIMATSLAYKGRRWFQAIDALEQDSLRLLSGTEFFQRDSTVTLLQTQDSMTIVWNVWQATLYLRHSEKDTVFTLPQILSSWTYSYQKHTKPDGKF